MGRYRWLGFVLVILLLSYFLRIGFFTYALYVVLALVLTSRLMSHHAPGQISHQRFCEVHRARIGDRVPVRIELRHTGLLPIPWLLLEDLTPAGLRRTGATAKVVTLRPGQRLTLRYTLDCDRRGYHQLGPLLLETGDLFGLFRRFEAGERAHYVTVHPQLVPIGGWDIASPRPVGEVRVERRIFEDPSRLRGVRQWRPGDKLTNIHWRATARTGQLQTKVFEPSTLLGALLCLDLYEPAYEGYDVEARSELAISAAASLAAYIAGGNQRVGFLTNGRDAADRARYEPLKIDAATRAQAEKLAAMKARSERLRPFEVPVGRGDAVVQQILDATARVELTDFQPVGLMLLREYPRLPRDVTLLVLTPKPDTALVEALGAMRRSGFVITVLVFGGYALEPAVRGRLLAAGVRCYPIDRPGQLAELAAVRL